MTMISDDVASVIRHGSGTVGAAAVNFLAAAGLSGPRKLSRGVQIRASDGNAGAIYVGASAAVTTGVAAPTTDGYPLAGGDAILVPIDDLAKVWLVATQAGQTFNFLAL